MAKPGEIVFDMDYDDDGELEMEYCVKIGKEISGGCQVEICGDIEVCPYFHDNK